MSPLRVLMLVVGMCLLMAVGAQGQTQKRGSVRSVDAAATVSRPVEPDSPATDSSVTASPQASLPKDQQIRTLTLEVEQLQRGQRQMAVARLARTQTEERMASSRDARRGKQGPKSAKTQVSQVQF